SRRVGPRSPWSASPANSWAWDWSSLPRRPRRRRRRLPGSGASGASAFGCSCCWPPACGAWPAAAGAPCWPLPPARSPSPAAAPPPAAAAGSGAPASPPSSSSHSDGGSSSGPAAGAAEDAAASSPAGSGRSTPAFGPRASSSPPSPPPWAAGSPAACSPRPAGRRDPVRDDEDRPPDASPAGSTPVSSRMSWMISALRARDGGLAPRAWAIVTSSSRSLRSRADRSRALGSTLIGGCHLTADWGEARSEEHTSELQSRENLVCRLLLDASAPMISTPSLHDALPISGELEDELDDLGLAGPRRRLGAEGLGDRDELLAVLALQGGPFEGAGLHAHRWLSPHC